MNWVFIIVLLVLVLGMVGGYYKGLLRIVYSLVSWIIVLIFVAWATPFMNHVLMQNTTIYETIELRCEEKIRQSAELETDERISDESQRFSELGLNLPESVIDRIMEKAAGTTDEFLETTGIYKQLASGIAGFVVEGIAFIVAMICAWIIVHLISQILGIVSKIPILHGINSTLGIFAGGAYALVLIWIAFYIIALCSTNEFGRMLVTHIYQSRLLTFLYENNVVLSFMLHFL